MFRTILFLCGIGLGFYLCGTPFVFVLTLLYIGNPKRATSNGSFIL